LDKIPEGASVVFYVRSSDEGQENSVPDQLHTLQQEADGNGWKVVEIYTDGARSGSTVEERPEFQRMIRDAGLGGFGYVVVYDISRFSRGGNIDLWPSVRELRKCKVRLYNHARKQFINNQNAIYATIDAAQAQAENLKRSKDCTRSSLENVTQRNRDPGRRAPYGYDLLRSKKKSGKPMNRIRYMPDGRKLVMDPEGLTIRDEYEPGEGIPADQALTTSLAKSSQDRVAVVERIFRLAKTHGTTYIANELNGEKIEGPCGEDWSRDTLRDLIQNPAYRGARAYGRKRRSRFHFIKNGKVAEYDDLESGQMHSARVPMDEWVVYENVHEPIVSAQEWQEAQDGAQERRMFTGLIRRGKNQARTYLLSGFLFCRHCRSPMNGQMVTSKGRRYPRYKCSKRYRKGKTVCPGCSLPVGVEDFIVDTIRPVVTGDAFMDRMRAKVRDEIKRHVAPLKPNTDDDVAALKKERAKLEKALEKAMDSLLEDENSVDMVKAKLKKWSGRVEEIDRTLQRKCPPPGKVKVEELVKECMAFYEDRVIGPVSRMQTALEPKVGAAEGQGSPEGNGDGPERQQDRTCVEGMKRLFRLINVRADFDKKGKEGILEFSPFWQHATG